MLPQFEVCASSVRVLCFLCLRFVTSSVRPGLEGPVASVRGAKTYLGSPLCSRFVLPLFPPGSATPSPLYEVCASFCSKFVLSLFEVCASFVRGLCFLCSRFVFPLFEVCASFVRGLCFLCSRFVLPFFEFCALFYYLCVSPSSGLCCTLLFQVSTK